MNAKEFHAAARRIEGLQRKLCGTEVERDAWKRSYQDLSKSAHQDLTEARKALHESLEERDEAIKELRESTQENKTLSAEVESLRAKLNAKTVEWPEWAKEGTRVRVRSTHCSITQAAQYCVGDEFVIEELDEDDWSANAGDGGRWAFIGDLEPVAEHVAPPVVPPQPQVGDKVRLIKRPSTADYDGRQWDYTWGGTGEIAVVNYVGLCVNVIRANGLKNDWPLSCVEVVK